MISTHLLAWLSVLYVKPAILLFLILTGVIIFSFWFHDRTQSDIKSVSWLRDNDWHIQFNGREGVDAQLTPMSLVLSFLVILVFKTAEGRRVNLILFSDAADAESFRRIKLRLTIITPSFFDQGDDKVF